MRLQCQHKRQLQLTACTGLGLRVGPRLREFFYCRDGKKIHQTWDLLFSLFSPPLLPLYNRLRLTRLELVDGALVDLRAEHLRLLQQVVLLQCTLQ